MIILDENIPREPRQLLDSWRVPFRQIGRDIGRGGMQDEEIIPLLHTLRRPTFFTLDNDFYKASLCHAPYCIVYIDADDRHTASFIRQLLRYAEFNTEARRMGHVIRVSSEGISFWLLHSNHEATLTWPR